MSFNKKFTKLLKKCDQHGNPISLTYKKKQTYQSTIGGLVTILSRLGVVAYFLVLVMKIVDKESKVTFKSNYKTANGDVQVYPLNTNTFDLAFTVGGNPQQKLLNLNQYIKYEFSYTESYMNETSPGVVDKVRKQTILGDTNCTSDRFAKLNKTMTEIGIQNAVWHCVNHLGFSLKGQYPSTTRTLMKLRLVPCTNTSTIDNVTCAPQTDIDTFITNSIVNVAVLNSYFDQDEFVTSPVKNDISLLIYNIKQGQGFTQVMNVKKHIVTTKDYWLSNFVNNQQYEFYQVNEQKVMVGELKSNSFDMFQIMFYCANEEIEIERIVVTFTDILATVGGFSSIIIFLTRQVAKSYAQSIFESQMIKKLYKVEVEPSSSINCNQINQSSRQLNQKSPDVNEAFNKGRLKDQLWQAIQSRKILKMKMMNLFFNQYSGFFCRKKDTKFTQWKNGQYLVQKQIDIVHILKEMRKMKMANKLLLKDYQYALLKYNSKAVIPFKDLGFKRDDSYRYKKKQLTMNNSIANQDYQALEKCIRRKKESEVNKKILRDLQGSINENTFIEKKPKPIENDLEKQYLEYQNPADTSKIPVMKYNENSLEEVTVQSPAKRDRPRKQQEANTSERRKIRQGNLDNSTTLVVNEFMDQSINKSTARKNNSKRKKSESS